VVIISTTKIIKTQLKTVKGKNTDVDNNNNNNNNNNDDDERKEKKRKEKQR